MHDKEKQKSFVMLDNCVTRTASAKRIICAHLAFDCFPIRKGRAVAAQKATTGG
jgi:hypothetical protein